MPSRRQTLSDAASRLHEAGVPDAALDAQWLLAHVLGMRRLSLLMELNSPLTEDEAARFAPLLTRRASGEPLQYVLGETDFMGHTFRVDNRVLIPRNDTETLCEAALARLRPGMRALDIGTGSGALAISMALACPGAQVTGTDISQDALAAARSNGAFLGASVTWLQSDLFSALAGQCFDLIVSNPPYIPTGELDGLQREVRREPRQALDGGPDGLAFYRRITEGLPGRLAPRGSLLLEVGDSQAQAVSACLRGLFNTIHILRDLQGLDRVVIGDGYAG